MKAMMAVAALALATGNLAHAGDDFNQGYKLGWKEGYMAWLVNWSVLPIRCFVFGVARIRILQRGSMPLPLGGTWPGSKKTMATASKAGNHLLGC